MRNREELFDFMQMCVKRKAEERRDTIARAFPIWFAEMYYVNPKDFFVPDGPHDGKIDCFFKTDNDRSVTHYVINSKFTAHFDKIAPPAFYAEAGQFARPFIHPETREDYLHRCVEEELRSRFRTLYRQYDDEATKLVFLTNCRKNENQLSSLKDYPVEFIHLDDLIQHLLDDLDIALPRTEEMKLTEIHQVLTPQEKDTGVSTAIVFARLIDFIKYMKADPYDLLFARNVRLDLRNTNVNREIRETFKSNPDEFAFSNNGITMLCEHYDHRPSHDLVIRNPRVVNGSQTLHSVREVENPSASARVMVRIITIPPAEGDVALRHSKRKDIINKISVRTNQQNPIKKWNLVANDDFQLDIYRAFRRNRLFYERREKEWSQRSRALRSNGIRRGPTIKRLTQLIASYHWDQKKLGPGIARNVGEIFDGAAYDAIQKTPPELAYQIFLLADRVFDELYMLAKKFDYVAGLKGYVDLMLFAVVAKAAKQFSTSKRSLTFDIESNEWKNLTQETVRFIYDDYRKEASLYKKKQRKQLTIANYFKTPYYATRLNERPIPKAVSKPARAIFG